MGKLQQSTNQWRNFLTQSLIKSGTDWEAAILSEQKWVKCSKLNRILTPATDNQWWKLTWLCILKPNLSFLSLLFDQGSEVRVTCSAATCSSLYKHLYNERSALLFVVTYDPGLPPAGISHLERREMLTLKWLSYSLFLCLTSILWC